MRYDKTRLELIEYRKNRIHLYFIGIWLIIISTGILLLKSNFLYEVLNRDVIIISISFLSVVILFPYYIGINHNYKNFSRNGNLIIINQSQLIFDFNDYKKTLSFNDIENISLFVNGYDEGPLSMPIFDKNPKKGNKNYIEITLSNNAPAKYEFYIKSEREMIILLNFIYLLNKKIQKIKVIKAAKN